MSGRQLTVNGMPSGGPGHHDLAPYSGSLTQRVAADTRQRPPRQPAALMFADVSGYTALSERLARQGRVGAEQLTAAINACFGELIDVVLDSGGDVLRFGGDALFVAFTGIDRVGRAVSSALRMQRAIRQLPAVPAPGGAVRLRQSIGVHDGTLVFHRWSGTWTEVVPFGPDVTEVLRCESAASAGEIVLSAAASAGLPDLDRMLSTTARAGGRRVIDRARHAVSAEVGWAPSVDIDRPKRKHCAALTLPPELRDVVVGRGAGADGEHRNSAIGFIAIDGLDMMIDDHTRVVALLDPVLSTIDRVGGELGVTLLSTDVAADGLKLIVAAGVPEARGDHAERLVETILAAIDAASVDAELRAGAASGVVFSGDVGHPHRRTYTVMGDVVNLAARLASAAPARSLLVSHALAASLPPTFAANWQAPLALKGKRHRVVPAVITHATQAPIADPVDVHLLGRRHELTSLVARVEQHPVVQLVAPRGMGATSLVATFVRSWPADSCVVAASVGDGAAPLRLIRRVIELLGGPEQWAHAAVLLGGVEGVARPSKRHQLAALLADVIVDCWQPGRLLVIDDLARSDEASLSVLAAVASRLRLGAESRRMLIVDQTEHVALGQGIVTLQPLDDTTVEQIITAAAEHPLADAELARLVRLAAGNPSFATQLSRLGPEAELPPSMESLLTARIDRLDPRRSRALRDLAVLGSEVPRAAADELLGPDSTIALDELATGFEGLITVEPLPEPTFVFNDNGVRTVALAGLARARARKLHASMAGWLEHRPVPSIDLVAAQWCGSGEADGILRWAPIAARRAKRIGATHAATQWLRSAVDAAERVGAPAPLRYELGRELADVAQLAGLLEVEAHALRSAQLSSGPAETAAIQVERAANARRRGEYRAAAMMLSRVAHVAVSDPALAAEVALERARQAQWRGSWRDALDLAEHAVDKARSANNPAAEHGAWTIVAHCRQALARDHFMAAAESALRTARESGNQQLVAIAIGNLAMIDDNRGRWKAASRGYRRSIELFDRCGDVVNAAYGRLAVASILVELGDVQAAEVQARASARVLAAAAVPADQVAAAESVATLALLRSGGLAGEEIARHLDLERERSVIILAADPELGCFQLARETEALLLGGQPHRALERAGELAELAMEFDEDHLLPAMTRRLRAGALLALGRQTEGEEAALEAWDRATSFGLVFEQAALIGLLAATGEQSPRMRSSLRVAARSTRRLGIVSQSLSHFDHRNRGVPGPTPMSSLSQTDVSG